MLTPFSASQKRTLGSSVSSHEDHQRSEFNIFMEFLSVLHQLIMKIIFYLSFFTAFICCPKDSYSQKSRISGLERPFPFKSIPDSVLGKIRFNTAKIKNFLPLFPSKMPVLKAEGNSRILVAKLDSVSPYFYNMPVKKLNLAD